MDEEEVKKEPEEKPESKDHQPRQMSCQSGEHIFLSSRENEGPSAQCAKCSIGFILSPGMTIHNGHIYQHGEQVI